MSGFEPEKYIARKIQNMPPSGIRKFFDVASTMKGVISLGVGEPDFATPWHIREEGVYTIEKLKLRYTSNAGSIELREQISAYYNRKFHVNYNPTDQIVVTVGASEGIDLALRAIIETGDEVLVPEPSYVSYKPCITMAGGVATVITTTEQDEFRLTPQSLEAAITSKTKALILPYPNNPTGAIMEKEDLEKITEILTKKDILVISDEIYAELTYGSQHVSIASIPGMYDKTIVLNGFSKAYSMTGWRLGYACGNKDIISAMTKIHQYIIMCAPTMSQYAGVAALRDGGSDVEEMKKEYDTRRRYMLKRFRDMGFTCFEPKGAFYLFPSIKSTGMSSEKFCEELLFKSNVAVVPGNAFGESGEGFIRCSYAYSLENIKIALNKIQDFINS